MSPRPPSLVLSRWTTASSSGRRLCVRKGEELEELEEEEGGAPALRYVHEAVLRGWCIQARWMEEALGELRGLLGPRLHAVSLEARGRALGGWTDTHARTHALTHAHT